MKKQFIKVFRNMNTLHEIFRTESGEKIYKKHTDFECEFFVPSNTKTEYSDLIDKTPLQRIKCNGFKDFKDKKENYDGLKTTFGSIQPENQFRFREYYNKPLVADIETVFFDIETGFNNSSLDEDNNLVFGAGFPKPDQANAPITCIGCYSSTRKRYVVFSLKELTEQEKQEPLLYNAKLLVCDSEVQMIEMFFGLMKKWDVDVLMGWNTNGFDFPFIVNRMAKLGMDLSIIDHQGLIQEDRYQKVMYPKSYYWLDYMDIYKNFTYVPRESYSLQAIAEAELGSSKVVYHDEGNLQEIYNNKYKLHTDYNIQDVALLVQLDEKIGLSSLAYNMAYLYCINFDEVLGTTGPWTQLLFCETRTKNLILPDKREKEEMGFEGGYVFCNPGYYEWIVSFDFASLYPSLIRAFNYCPSTYIREKDLPVELKMIRSELNIKDTFEGIQEQLDFTAEQKLKLSSLLQKYNVSMSPSGHFFRTEEQGIFPYLMEKIYKERKAAKKLMTQSEIKLKELEKEKGVDFLEQKEKLEKEISTYNNKQMSLKICLNSAYGAFSSSYFLLSRKAIGESITSGGRLADKKASYEVDKVLTEKFDYSKTPYKSSIIANDTDSAYLSLSPIVEKNCEGMSDLEKVSYINTKIVPSIEKIIKSKALADISSTYNLLDREVLDMEQEVVANCGIYVGKKNYILNLMYKEGVTYPEGKEKVTGLQIKKTNLPAFVRKKMKDFTKIMFEKDELKFQKEFSKFKKEFSELPVSDICFPKGINLTTDKNRGGCIEIGHDKYLYTLQSVGCPAHVKAALRYNQYITENNLLGKYNIIEDGAKIKFIYLEGNDSMGFPNDRQHQTFIEDNNFAETIDYKKMFEGIVIKPLEPLVECLGWSFEKKFRITDFM